jgi:hypothetical protein
MPSRSQGRSSRILPRPDLRSVFLNVPFDEQYGDLFVALIAGLVCLGRKPRCVLEIESSGRSRLERIFGLLAGCGASIHEMSRVQLSGPLNVPRFNMPFELGIAYALSRRRQHAFFLFEEVAHRIEHSLNDLNGHEPLIHGGSPAGVLGCVLDCFETPRRPPSLKDLLSVYEELAEVVYGLQQDRKQPDPFRRQIFRSTVEAAAVLAKAHGHIR